MPRKSSEVEQLIEQRKAERKAKQKKRSERTAYRKRKVLGSALAKIDKARKEAKKILKGRMWADATIYYEMMIESDALYPVLRTLSKRQLLPTVLLLAYLHDKDFIQMVHFYAEAQVFFKEDQNRYKAVMAFLVRNGLVEKQAIKKTLNAYWLSVEGREMSQTLYRRLSDKFVQRNPMVLAELRTRNGNNRLVTERARQFIRKNTKRRTDINTSKSSPK